MQFTLAHLMWAMAFVAAVLALVAADRKWGPRPSRDPTLVYSNMEAPFTYELAVGHPDQHWTDTHYVCSVLYEPKSMAWRRTVDWSAIGTPPYERSTAAPQIVQAYEDAGWTVLGMAADVRREQKSPAGDATEP